MNRYIVGQTVFLRVRISDPSTGDADDPATQDPVDDGTQSFTVYAPDGTSSVPPHTHGLTGVYTATYTTTQDGIHEYTSLSTGAGTGGWKERFYVSPVP